RTIASLTLTFWGLESACFQAPFWRLPAMAAPELRPMGIGDILDTTFRLYRARLGTFLTITLSAYVPLALIVSLFQISLGVVPRSPFQAGVTTQGPIQSPPLTPPNLMAALGASLGMLVFALVVVPLCNGALIHNISAAYLGEGLSAWQSYARAAPRLVRLILA